MKRLIALLLMIMLLVPALAAQAETWYVYTKNGKTLNLRDEFTSKVIGNIPYGTALEPDSSKSTEKSAYVTYGGVSGYVKWEFLQKDRPKSRASATATPRPVSGGVPYQAGSGSIPDQGPDESAGFEITALGAYIQYANRKNKAEGDKWETLHVTESDNIVITADIPRGKKIDYWVINGVRYDFQSMVKSIRLTKADCDFQFEVVYTKSESSTLISPQSIQDARTGEQLIIQGRHAQLCHIKTKTTGAGGWLNSFDFTEDYVNRATGAPESGGQVTAKVKAVIPKNQKVKGWKFNQTELYPNAGITYFVVRTLNVSMTYEPIFGAKKAANPQPKAPGVTAPPVVPPTEPAPTLHRTVFYTVTCEGCTFSGGGYTNATSGKVPEGTQISVSTVYGGGVSRWTVNGSEKMIVRNLGKAGRYKETFTGSSFKMTVNKNTSIVSIMKIN